jgi:hypothetical protein
MAKNTVEKKRKKYSHAPTPRKIKAVKNFAENGGNAYKALLDAGYSESYARNAHKFKGTESTQDLLDTMMPRSLVADVHVGLLKSKKLEYMQFPVDVGDDVVYELAQDTNTIVKKIVQSKFIKHVWIWVPNDKARKDAVEMAYKLRGEFAPEKYEVSDPIKQMSDEELLAEIREMKGFFTKGRKK